MEPEQYLSDRERLANALRELRHAREMTGKEAAQAAGMSQPKISKLENGHLLPSVEDVATLLDLYEADGLARDDLLETTTRLHASIESNRTILRQGAARKQAQIGQVESEATVLRYFSPVVIPGLLQSSEYMRRVFALELAEADLARAVTARQQRQHVLYDRSKRFIFVISEAALRWRFCPDPVMAALVGHISSLATLNNVDIGIIPFSAQPADIPLHGYEIFDERLITIGLEHATITVTDPRDIAAYLRLFNIMVAAAEFGDAVILRLKAIRDGYRD
jgi:transcriptional regulator with XRE-family HTH domain